jgi:hypothetical protein
MRNLEDLDVDLIESVGDEPVDCEGFVQPQPHVLASNDWF